MAPERWRRIRAVVDAAIEAGGGQGAPSADAVEVVLTRECGDDQELRREVESLLAAHAAAGPLDRSPFVLLSAAPAEPADLRIGPYRVVREIGRGGMGAVFLAERDDQEFEQRVAIKQVGGGAWRPDLVERFRVERQILARLDHPGIARLLDGGTTDDGLPYVVMEHVDGRPIDRYCDEERLDVEARIELFLAVAEAVDAAHRNLIVHRDLKPSNVLVTAEGAPKLLDFGIAKPLDPIAGGEAATFTALAMTPQYASPEQVRGELATPASDVYSLGMLLYELLAGRRPYTFEGRSVAEIERTVTQGEVPPPSEAVRRAGSAPEATAAAAARRTTPERLRRRLAGDLDTIVGKALRVEPDRRYPSVRELAADLIRHQRSEPVLARPDSLSYRAGRFVRRHRFGVAAAGLLLAVLAGGVGATLHQARVAEGQRERAERRFAEVRELAGSFIFEIDDAVAELPGSTPVRELIVRRALDYLERLSRDAAADPELTRELVVAWRKIGDIQGGPRTASLGDLAGAAESYRRAHELLSPLVESAGLPEDRRTLGDLTRRIGDVLWWQGETEQAVAHFRRAADLHQAVRAERPDDAENLAGLAAAWTALGNLHSWNRSNTEALGYFEAARPLLRRLREDGEHAGAARDLAVLETSIGDTLTWDGRAAEGLERLDGAIAMLEELGTEATRDKSTTEALAVAEIKRSEALVELGRHEAALAAADAALRYYDRLARADPFDLTSRRYVALGHAKRGDVLVAVEREPEATAAYRRSLEITREIVAADPTNASHKHDLGNAHGRLGRALEAAGELEAAAAEYDRALAVRREVLAADPEESAALRALYLSQSDLGDVHLGLARREPPGAGRRNQAERAAEWLLAARASLAELAARGALSATDAGETDSVERRLAEAGELAGTG